MKLFCITYADDLHYTELEAESEAEVKKIWQEQAYDGWIVSIDERPKKEVEER
jgi:hypothetical protein